MSLLNLTWMLTGLAAVVVLITRTRLRATQHQSGVFQVPLAVLHGHTGVGVLALAAWAWWLSGAPDPVGYVALALWWVVAALGVLILARWLPSHGSHSTPATDDDLAEGPALSILGHVGMVLGVAFFTWAMVADKL